MWLLLVEILATHLEHVLTSVTNTLPTENHLVDQVVTASCKNALPQRRGSLPIEVNPDILMNVVTPLEGSQTTLRFRQLVPPSYLGCAATKDHPDSIES